MKICAVSDLHGFYPEIESSDLLIVAGDCTYTNKQSEWDDFFKWLESTPAKNRILVGGNHDNLLFNKYIGKYGGTGENHPFYYLCNEEVTLDGFKIYGSPNTPWFPGVRDSFSYFMYKDGKDPWDLLYDGIDILITHGPPRGILDESIRKKKVGCPVLLDKVRETKPKLHIFGHIHEGHGHKKIGETDFYNVAINDENYIPHRKPTYI